MKDSGGHGPEIIRGLYILHSSYWQVYMIHAYNLINRD